MMEKKKIAIACQGGGSHAAYSAGVLQELLPELEKQGQNLDVVGISGTSGGAICALLAWYGMLEGGPITAKKKLQDFWQRNSAALPGEKLCNELSVLGVHSLPFELQFSPYVFPLLNVVSFGTELWPLSARLMGSANWWMRRDYFLLGELISYDVDFDLIDALGKFSSIPRDVERWLDLKFQRDISSEGPDRTRVIQAMGDLEQKIRDNLNAGSTIKELTRDGKFTGGPLQSIFQKWEEDPSLNRTALEDISRRVSELTAEIPQLLIGAADINTGDFISFSSERAPGDGGISLHAVLASAAIPWLFKAVKVGEHEYWDGLFSQNPPIKNFMAGLHDEKKKPDEIWVVQINPSAYGGNDISGDIWNRRNELSGNLSLNQEIGFIDAINKELQTHGTSSSDRKYIQVHRIAMDVPTVEQIAGVNLGAASKLNRSSVLKDALMRHGQEQAKRFFGVHAFLEQVNDDADASRGALREIFASANITMEALEGQWPAESNHRLHLFIDGIYPASREQSGADVTVAWHTRIGMREPHLQLSFEGKLDLLIDDGRVSKKGFKDVKVTRAKRPKK